MTTKTDQTIDTILFDLGGVLVELNPFPLEPAWYRESTTLEDARNEWLDSSIAQDFERGDINAQEFATRYIAEHKLQVTPERFLEKFRQWPRALYPGVTDFLSTLRTHYQIAVFSNNNELHWKRILHEMDLQNRFDQYFASQLIGQLKPDVNAFLYVASELRKKPQVILFLDDNIKNVEAARKAGLQAEHVVGFDETRSRLVDLLGTSIESPKV